MASALDDPSGAARLAGMAEKLRGEMGYRVELIERPLHERTLITISAIMDESNLEQMLSEGRNMEFEQIMAYQLR